MSDPAPDLRPVPLEPVEGVEVAEVRALPPAIRSPVPSSAMTVAATSFVAGVATAAVMRRRSARKLARRGRRGRLMDALPVVGSRSFLVDVHLLGRE
ncbi:MAG: hypothetical protein QOK31_1984 [Solirubrobacteraceae bacterium]|jgi:hypothetical protein|nr:hypothetical protein [Solirubrobacteraceae bacterium]